MRKKAGKPLRDLASGGKARLVHVNEQVRSLSAAPSAWRRRRHLFSHDSDLESLLLPSVKNSPPASRSSLCHCCCAGITGLLLRLGIRDR
ncbi:MAG: YfeC-like transcriptional regulator [Escherichia coli]